MTYYTLQQSTAVHKAGSSIVIEPAGVFRNQYGSTQLFTVSVLDEHGALVWNLSENVPAPEAIKQAEWQKDVWESTLDLMLIAKNS